MRRHKLKNQFGIKFPIPHTNAHTHTHINTHLIKKAKMLKYFF